MTVKDLIDTKDYPLIQFRLTCPWDKKGEFFGVCKSENGKLISLDGDIYDEDDDVVHYEEFEYDGQTCLDITIHGEWVNGRGENYAE